ncbi:MAG: AMP-binding protein [Gammaproteobacteria bacterium]|nr:AMP-binding protein [Gammaproteobacteria bacterium]
MEKYWVKSYPQGVPQEIADERASDVVQLFENSIERFASRPAFTNLGATLTFVEIAQKTQALAAYLQQKLGFNTGDRVAIMMPNVLQNPIAIFGVLRAGMTVVNTNPLYTPRELVHQLKDSGARAIIILENFAHVLAEVIDQTEVEHVVVTKMGDCLPLPKSLVVNFVVKYVKKMVPRFQLSKTLAFNDVLAEGAELDYQRPPLTGADIAFLQYTGGTTGVSKGAVLSHGNISSNVEQARLWINPVIKEGDELIVTALPLYHIFSLTANCLTYMQVGAQNYLITNPRDMPGFVKELKSIRPTAITGVNTLFNGLLNTPGFEAVDFSRLRVALGGGMAVQRAVAQRWQQATGIPLLEAYGLTETSPGVTINPLDRKDYSGSTGLPLPSTDVAIRDEEGNALGLNEAGELYVRGPQVMQGYWNRPEETAEVLSEDGWLRTGDVATIDAQGYVYIVDRKKDLILVSGFNVYPNEIEDVVAAHPGVLEVGAIGEPDEHSGEVVKIVVVKKDPGLTEEQIIAHCKSNLTGYKVPKFVEFRRELPKTNVGKILRRELRGTVTSISNTQ